MTGKLTCDELYLVYTSRLRLLMVKKQSTATEAIQKPSYSTYFSESLPQRKDAS